MIPNIAFDFNFDYVLVLIFGSYVFYGYFSGGHKQIRLSITLILPFLIIYYLGSYITSWMYIPLSSTFFFELISLYLGIIKNTFGMLLAYIITYLLLFASIFTLSIYAKKYVLNENMRAKLGKKNNYLGAFFALLNVYVLIYFLILPVFTMNVIDSNAHLTNFILQNPPPFSRIARTAEKAVPIKSLADKANDFQQLMSVEGIEGYYDEAIYKYQQQYIGDDSFESEFMEVVYSELSLDSKTLLNNEYFDYFGEELTPTNYLGVSLILVTESSTSDYLYLDILEIESDFDTELKEYEDIVSTYETSLASYDSDVENYLYSVAYEAYLDDLDTYLEEAESFVTDRITALLNDDPFDETFDLERPIKEVAPINYIHNGELEEPLEVVLTSTVSDAIDFIAEYTDKLDVRDELRVLGVNFANHRGLLTWYIEDLSNDIAQAGSGTDISEVIVSFKTNYESIISDIKDEELESKLYLAQMSITSYDVFSTWLECTKDNIDNVALEDLEASGYRCINLDTSLVTEYDFTENALSIATTLFEGDSVSWIILQFKYDYEAGGFVEEFAEYKEILDILESTKDLADDYDEFYKDIANSLEGNLSMVFKIGISVMKYHIDVYDTLSHIPFLSAVFNDAARVCVGSDFSPINRDVEICPKTDGDGGFAREIINMRYLISDILFKAYIMVDDENEAIIYDSIKMNELLDEINGSVEDNVITKEVVSMFADQLAFNIIDDATNYTLLEQMYDNGQITIEAMRILADDEYDLFSIEFRLRVRSLIR